MLRSVRDLKEKEKKKKKKHISIDLKSGDLAAHGKEISRLKWIKRKTRCCR